VLAGLTDRLAYLRAAMPPAAARLGTPAAPRALALTY